MKHFGLTLTLMLLALLITACGSKNDDTPSQKNQARRDATESCGIDCVDETASGQLPGAVFIRVWNRTGMALDGTTLYFGGRPKGEEFGSIEADALTDYMPVETAYRIVEITVSTDNLKSETLAQPIDYVGETALPPGYYTYSLRLNGTATLLEVEMLQAVAMVERVGGLCTYGSCHLAVTLYDTGLIVAEDGAGQVEIGSIHSPTIARLEAEISTANYFALRAEPFTGTCPTAYDGSEMIYTFYTLLGPQTIANCTYAIQDDLAPFVALFAALNESNLSVLSDGSFESIFG